MPVTGARALHDHMARLFEQGAPDRIGVAVSGGGDSMALLALLGDWAQETGAGLAVVSVDHGLRPEAGDEIALARALAADRGWPHDTLRWDWDGQGNVQDAARRARRALITGWARDHGIGAVALGHTADDQAETVLMRLARGSGVDGLAAMAPRTDIGGIAWIRPLLTWRRAVLRDTLRARGIAWADDPSNEDPRYDRVKARRALAALEPMGLSVDRLTATAGHMRRAAHALHRATCDLAARAVQQQGGDLVLRHAVLADAPDEIATRLFAAALQWVSGQGYRPRYRALRDAMDSATRHVLHGCLIVPGKGNDLRIAREWAAVRDLSAPPDAPWDGRWTLSGAMPPDARIAALGENGLAQCPGWRDTGLPRDSLLASPALWRGDTLLAAPLASPGCGITAQLRPDKADFLRWLRSHPHYRIEHEAGMSI